MVLRVTASTAITPLACDSSVGTSFLQIQCGAVRSGDKHRRCGMYSMLMRRGVITLTIFAREFPGFRRRGHRLGVVGA